VAGSGRRRVGWIVLVLAVTVGSATPIAWWLTQPSIDAGTVPQLAAHRGPAGEVISVRPATTVIPTIGVHTGRLADEPRGHAGAVPVRIQIPSIGVDAPVVPVGVDATGGVDVPQDVRVAGWYRFGSAPGADGSAVVLGHVDSAIQGTGVFFRLQTIPVGATVRIELRGGAAVTYRVVARRAYLKTRLPPSLFRRSGPTGLALITCGGPFDPSRHRYQDNVVVYAEPA
jgi:LPXTG-site transpeptidase (sortase) family protein